MRFFREEEEPGITLVSMTDIVFLLLIFFMVSTQFITFQKRLTIELPETKAGQVITKTKEYVIEITKDEKIYLNGKEITYEQLALILQKDRKIPKKSALIRADKRVLYGLVVKVLGLLKANGVNEIGIAVK